MTQRRFPIGAEVKTLGVHFRVWAPDQDSLHVVLEGTHRVKLDRDAEGYHEGWVDDLAVGQRYQLALSNGDLVPDPASRFQPDGPHGPSIIVDPTLFPWTDAEWKGRPLDEFAVYELHVGTFTQEGTWAAATRELSELAAAGITCIEVMPVADFPGEFGWGYDGVCMFAPTRLYGSPDDFRRFVDVAHSLGLCVILDVVYNHLGPDGNYLSKFAKAYFTDRYKTEWGEPINFDGPDSGPVQEFFVTNAAYWIQEFHLDGLRLDATQAIYDSAPPARHIITRIGQRARAAAQNRIIVLIAENETQHSDLSLPVSEGGYGLDALWNDDVHHSAMVALTEQREAYYTDYRGEPQEFVSAAKYGYLYQGQWYSWQKNRRGTPCFALPSTAFVAFLQNHDQIANSGKGERVHQLADDGQYRALSTMILLGPSTPMLFQGQEFAASTPFLYFADHNPELNRLVDAGRRAFLSQFPSLHESIRKNALSVPGDRQTFESCKLNFTERQTNAPQYQLTRDLLNLRQRDPAFRMETRLALDGAVLGPQALLLRYFLHDGCDRLLLVNWGHEIHWLTAPEPLLAPPRGTRWQVAFSTDDAPYGGPGSCPVEVKDHGWRFPGKAATFLHAEPVPDNEIIEDGSPLS